MAGKPYPKPSGRRRSIGRTSALQVDRIRERIFDRDERACLAAGRLCDGPLTIQHAVGRGMGGSARLDYPSLLRTLCWMHNGLIEIDAGFRDLAEINGWAIRRFATTTAVPVLYPGARWFTLDDEFGRTQVWPAP